MGKFVDLTGKVFGRLYVKERREIGYKGNYKWLCVCECGNYLSVLGNHLTTGNTKSCGCLNKENIRRSVFKDLIGNRFGKLVVVEYVGVLGEKGKRYSSWRCLCNCGTECICSGVSLTKSSKPTRSCGCMRIGDKPYIYVMKSEKYNLVKIGISRNPFDRKDSIVQYYSDDTIHILYAWYGSVQEERKLHKLLKDYNTPHPNQFNSKEWFDAVDAVMNLIVGWVSNMSDCLTF